MNRWLGTLFVGFSVSALALAGCGDDSEEEDGGSQSSTAEVNEQATAAIVAQSTRSISNLQAGDGYSAAMGMASVGSAAFGILSPGGGSGAQAADLGVATQAACDGAEELCTGDAESGSCTFTSCSDAGYAIEGSVSWTSSSLDCDLTFTIESEASGASSTGTFHVFCDIDYTSTSIDGTVSTDGDSSTSANGQTVDASWDTSVTYNEVTFPEGGGCPTGGSVDVSASVEVNGQGYEGSGSVSFPSDLCTG